MTLISRALPTSLILILLAGCAPAGNFVLIRDAIVIDGTGGPSRDRTSILIKDDRIEDVGADLRAPRGATVIDAGGQTVLPGLFNMHGHLYGRGADQTVAQHETYATLYLAGGVTSVFSPGSRDPEGVIETRARIAAGEMPGPRIYLAGRYIDRKLSQVSWIDGFVTAKEAIAYIDQAADELVAVKLYTSVDRGFAEAVIAAAHRRGLFVTGHIGALSAREAIEAGIDGLEHGLFAIKEIVGGDTTLGVICAVAAADIDGPEARAIIRLLAENGVYLTPTITIFAAFGGEDRTLPYDWRRFLSADARRTWADIENTVMSVPPEIKGCVDDAIAKQVAFVGQAHRAGVRILAGTDPILPSVTPGYALQREIRYLIEAGLSVEAAIRSASLDAAEVLGVDADFGSLEAGKVADLVIVDGDIRRDPSALLRTVKVIKAGVSHDPEQLRTAAEGGIR